MVYNTVQRLRLRTSWVRIPVKTKYFYCFKVSICYKLLWSRPVINVYFLLENTFWSVRHHTYDSDIYPYFSVCIFESWLSRKIYEKTSFWQLCYTHIKTSLKPRKCYLPLSAQICMYVSMYMAATHNLARALGSGQVLLPFLNLDSCIFLLPPSCHCPRTNIL
jgi:hypothetical protein